VTHETGFALPQLVFRCFMRSVARPSAAEYIPKTHESGHVAATISQSFMYS